MNDDAERFAPIDARRVARISNRFGDKRHDISSRRFVRVVGHASLILAACGCGHRVVKVGVCPICGGAELSAEERTS